MELRVSLKELVMYAKPDETSKAKIKEYVQVCRQKLGKYDSSTDEVGIESVLLAIAQSVESQRGIGELCRCAPAFSLHGAALCLNSSFRFSSIVLADTISSSLSLEICAMLLMILAQN